MIENDQIQKSRIGTELEIVTTIGRLKDHFGINFGWNRALYRCALKILLNRKKILISSRARRWFKEINFFWAIFAFAIQGIIGRTGQFLN